MNRPGMLGGSVLVSRSADDVTIRIGLVFTLTVVGIHLGLSL